MYDVVMHGITGDFHTEYNTYEEAVNAAENIRLLGYDAEVKEV